MSPIIVVFSILCVLVLFLLALFYKRDVSRLKLVLVLGGLVLLSLAIAFYLNGSFSTNSTEPEHSASPQPTLPTTPQPTQQLPVSPISPVSPVAGPHPVMVEVEFSEIESGGCFAFASNRTGNFEIFVLQGTIDNLEQLTDDPGLDINPEWSPDGKRIVFASNREADTGIQLYVVDVGDPVPVRLGAVQPGDNAHPTWSPDGKKIAFQSKRDINSNPRDDNLDIYVVNSDGSDVIVLASHGADESEPIWSPDGARIAFISERDGQDEIYVMNSDGTDQMRLTDIPVLKSGLNWSDDGRFIVFEGDSDIYVLDVETREASNVTQTPAANETTPEWVSEDVIVFSSNRNENFDLYLADISDPNEISIARLTDDPGVDHSPAWFPCGTD